LSQEAAEDRLERWLGEYHATSHQRGQAVRGAQAVALAR